MKEYIFIVDSSEKKQQIYCPFFLDIAYVIFLYRNHTHFLYEIIENEKPFLTFSHYISPKWRVLDATDMTIIIFHLTIANKIVQ